MLIISQNKEKVMRFGISFNALKYAERTDRKGKQTIVRHTICISDGYRSCPMMVNGTCEKCLRELNEAIQGGKEQ